MTPPSGPLLAYPELPSTQDEAARLLAHNQPVGIVHALHQSSGRGRFHRPWISRPGDSLTASFVFSNYADHKEPWLIGMALALAVAGTLRTQIRWPNDITLGGLKLGGILTELHPDPQGRKIPVIGLGLNLNQQEFPQEIQTSATSLHLARQTLFDPDAVLQSVLDSLDTTPEPASWESLEPAWNLFDDTPGKLYRLLDGKEATALGLGPGGQLICSVEGETQSVLAADAIFGP